MKTEERQTDARARETDEASPQHTEPNASSGDTQPARLVRKTSNAAKWATDVGEDEKATARAKKPER